jgi:hypothetical protein
MVHIILEKRVEKVPIIVSCFSIDSVSGFALESNIRVPYSGFALDPQNKGPNPEPEK